MEKNQPICVSVWPQPTVATSAPMGTSQSTAAATNTLARRDQRKRACSGVGVSSSISAGPNRLPDAACPPPDLNAPGAQRPHTYPTNAATATMAGNGTLNRPMATNEASASAHRPGLVNVLLPMRCAACNTMAVTAGLMP